MMILCGIRSEEQKEESLDQLSKQMQEVFREREGVLGDLLKKNKRLFNRKSR